MIVDLPSTTTGALTRTLVDLKESGGSVALGRVMTLVIVTDDVEAESAIAAANQASKEHPCRVLAVARGTRRSASRLDAQVRIGGDAGASEVVVLRLYGPLADHGDSVIVPMLLPDTPIVVWWPAAAPEVPAEDSIGRMAHRRITDSSAAKNPARVLNQRATVHAPGDTDLAWSRVTHWRAQLAASLDLPPFEPVTRATVTGASDSPSSELLAAWLALCLRCPVVRQRTPAGSGMVAVTLERASGTVSLHRPDGTTATLLQPGQPERQIAMPRRTDVECLVEELRRLDPDEVFAEVVTRGLALLPRSSTKGSTSRGSTPNGSAKSSAKASAKGSTAKHSTKSTSAAAVGGRASRDGRPTGGSTEKPAQPASAKKGD